MPRLACCRVILAGSVAVALIAAVVPIACCEGASQL